MGDQPALREYDDAQRDVRSSAIAEGNRIQEEREIFRKRSAALVQGFRTRDAAFRIFRNEKLERYKTLFDLASRYAFLPPMPTTMRPACWAPTPGASLYPAHHPVPGPRRRRIRWRTPIRGQQYRRSRDSPAPWPR